MDDDTPTDGKAPNKRQVALQQARDDLADAVEQRMQGKGSDGQVLRAGRKLKKAAAVLAAGRRPRPKG